MPFFYNKMKEKKQQLILFDGDCNFCNRWVHFIIKHDPEAKFRFAINQGQKGQQVLMDYNLPKGQIGTVILISDGKLFQKSTSVIKIARQLSGWPSLVYFTIVIPRFIRDFIYNIFAKNRYKWFGKRENCKPFPKNITSRFFI
jgi:predicted DCC family thiol-disulfide oxidoreductase YuxK